MGEVMRMHEERCGGLTAACNGLDGLFGCLFSLPRAQNGPLACCSLLAGVWLQLLMRTLINAVNAGHGGKWAHAKGYIRKLIREILKKLCADKRGPEGVLLMFLLRLRNMRLSSKKKSPSSRFRMHENLVLLAIWMIPER